MKKDLSERIIILGDKDNVATVLKDLDKNSYIKVFKKNKKEETIVKIKDYISAGFKVSIADISKNERIIKYGYSIGVAKMDIKAGERVHVENMSSLIR